jgi:hypothetical protein
MRSVTGKQIVAQAKRDRADDLRKAHANNCKHADKLVKNKERRAAIPLSAKADSPLAA